MNQLTEKKEQNCDSDSSRIDSFIPLFLGRKLRYLSVVLSSSPLVGKRASVSHEIYPRLSILPSKSLWGESALNFMQI